MAKSSNKSRDAAPSEAAAAVPASETQNGVGPTLSENVGAGKPIQAAVKTSRKRPAGAARKTTASAKPRKPAARKKEAPAEAVVSDDDLRLRAYFIAEHRAQSGFPGDSASDWLEARRQLLEEAARPA